MSQMDVGVRYWNNRKNIAETRYFDSKFMRQPNAYVLLKNLDESISSVNRGAVSPVNNGCTPGKLERFEIT